MLRNINNRKDILLLLLYAPGKSKQKNEPISGRTRIVKMMFLFRQELIKKFKENTTIDENNFYTFFPWDFGPFSRDIYDDLTFFILRGFIENPVPSNEEGLPESAEEWEQWLAEVDLENDVQEYQEEEFLLTEKGQQFAASLWDTLSGNQQRILSEFKARTSTAPLRGLLRYVYENYPDMTISSTIREAVLGHN